MNTQSPVNMESSCLEFRREKLADPRHLSARAIAHLEHCSLCQAFARRAEAADQRITQSLNAINVPEGLNERILLRARHGKRQSWRGYALAASVLLAVFSALGMWQIDANRSTPDLAAAVTEHVHGEGLELAVHHTEPVGRFPAILASFGGKLESPIGDISYIHLCPIEGFGMGWHIIYQTPQGKVTLLLIAAGEGAAKVQTVQIDGKSVRVERAGQGYYALITDDMKTLDSADQRIRRAVRWNT